MSLWAFRLVLFYLVILLVQPQNRFPFLWPWRIALVAMIAAIIFHAVSASQENRPIIRFGPATITALLLMFFSFISLHFGTFQTSSHWNPNIDMIFKNCVCLILIEAMATTVERVWAVYISIMLATLWWIKGGLRLSAAGATHSGDRMMGPAVSLVNDPNGFAFLMTLMIPLYFYVYQHSTSRNLKYGGIFCMLSAVYIALQTGSRTGMLCLIGCGILMLPKLTLRHKPLLAFVGVSLFFILGTVSAVNMERYASIMDSVRNFMGNEDDVAMEDKNPMEMTQNEQSAWERRMKNKHSVAVVKQHPFFGVGVNFDWNMVPDEYKYARGMVHNDWLYAGMQMGIIGMSMYASLLLTLIITSRLVYRYASSFWPSLSAMGWMSSIAAGIYAIGGFFSPISWNPLLLAFVGASSALWSNIRAQSWNKATDQFNRT